jgi:3-oxoacyl-[acyl-carrier protein] reductase
MSSVVSRAFEGRVALVTGGSGGIGAAICGALSEAGATVAIGYGSSAEAAERLADRLGAQAFGADLEDPGGPERLVREVECELGPLDVLVSNHGIAHGKGWEEIDAEHFDRTIAVNLRAPFLLVQAALPAMRERGFGRILFVSSVAAFTGGIVGPDYAASKAGLNAITHFLATRAAGDGVTVNALAPGFVDTPMLPSDTSELASAVPVERVGTPEEVADLALAVLRNGYLTNQVLVIDGGRYPR